ncbi:MAG TPA: aromatic ring-hydroxylating dioxygenase subunit alpha [Kofleriaceae bacterium]|nr:aromatic ring-hydroxylating dioxygenase subunit alpha [Kofleriaceae bacterium]
MPAPVPPTQIDGIDLSPLPTGHLLPPRAFVSPTVFDAEEAAVWGRAWVHVADVGDLRERGDYVAATIGQTPVVVLRDRDSGELRGYVNACRHRGAQLVEGKGRCEKQLKCPYHGWSYGHDGRLIGVPYRETEFAGCDLSAMGLLPVRVGTVGPLVFATLDEHAPSLAEWTGTLSADFAAAGVTEWKLGWELTYEVDANWKLFVENANDGYHIPVVHDVLLDLLKQENGQTTLEPHGAYSWAKINPAYVPPGEDPDAARIRFGCVFPNFIPVLSPVDLTYMRVDPVAPGRFRLFVRSYDEPTKGAPLRELRRAAFERTTDQDIAVVKKVHRGLHAAGLPAGIHASQLEARIGHFEQLWVTAMAQSVGGMRPGQAALAMVR